LRRGGSKKATALRESFVQGKGGRKRAKGKRGKRETPLIVPGKGGKGRSKKLRWPDGKGAKPIDDKYKGSDWGEKKESCLI